MCGSGYTGGHAESQADIAGNNGSARGRGVIWGSAANRQGPSTYARNPALAPGIRPGLSGGCVAVPAEHPPVVLDARACLVQLSGLRSGSNPESRAGTHRLQPRQLLRLARRGGGLPAVGGLRHLGGVLSEPRASRAPVVGPHADHPHRQPRRPAARRGGKPPGRRRRPRRGPGRDPLPRGAEHPFRQHAAVRPGGGADPEEDDGARNGRPHLHGRPMGQRPEPPRRPHRAEVA